MLIEIFLSVIVGLLTTAISGLGGVVSLPVEVIEVLSTIWGYGTFILGSDIFVLCMSSFFFWFFARFTIGLISFVWHLLPLT